MMRCVAIVLFVFSAFQNSYSLNEISSYADNTSFENVWCQYSNLSFNTPFFDLSEQDFNFDTFPEDNSRFIFFFYNESKLNSTNNCQGSILNILLPNHLDIPPPFLQ